MNQNHRETALRLLDSTDVSLAAAFEKTLPIADQQHAAVLSSILTTRAMVHATLARNEETTVSTPADKQDSIRPLLRTLIERWEEVAEAFKPEYIGVDMDNVARRYEYYRQTYQTTIHDLEHVLDEGKIPCPLMTVEERLRGDCGHLHAGNVAAGRTARKPVAAATPADDPWARKRDVTADIPEPVRRMLAQRIADMLLDPDDAVTDAARGLAFALKDEGVDLTNAIKARISDKTLGRDPAEAPF